MNLKRLDALSHHCSNFQANLMIASKNYSVAHIQELLIHGQTLFGENKLQEAQTKWIDLLKAFPHTQLHLIGPLQTNKVKDAFQLFHTIQSLDREKLALKIQELFVTTKGVLKSLLIQVNTGNESQKAGIKPSEADDFIKYCLHDLRLPVQGLMCIPPKDEDCQPHFSYLATLALHHNLTILSMGMSNDYEKALTCGSTMIRIGRYILGPSS